jgi:hypothetical protein
LKTILRNGFSGWLSLIDSLPENPEVRLQFTSVVALCSSWLTTTPVSAAIPWEELFPLRGKYRDRP